MIKSLASEYTWKSISVIEYIDGFKLINVPLYKLLPLLICVAPNGHQLFNCHYTNIMLEILIVASHDTELAIILTVS